jgi:hypothetical protein
VVASRCSLAHTDVAGTRWVLEDEAPLASPDGLAAGRSHVPGGSDAPDGGPVVELVPPVGSAGAPGGSVGQPQESLGAVPGGIAADAT